MRVVLLVSALLSSALAQYMDPMAGLLAPAPSHLYTIRGPIYVEPSSLDPHPYMGNQYQVGPSHVVGPPIMGPPLMSSPVSPPILSSPVSPPMLSSPPHYGQPQVVGPPMVGPPMIGAPIYGQAVLSPSPYNPYQPSYPYQMLYDEQQDEVSPTRRYNTNVQSGIQQFGHGNMNLQGNIQQVNRRSSYSQQQQASQKFESSNNPNQRNGIAQADQLGLQQKDEANLYALGHMQKDEVHMHGLGQLHNDQAQLFAQRQNQNDQSQWYNRGGILHDRPASPYGYGQIQVDPAQLDAILASKRYQAQMYGHGQLRNDQAQLYGRGQIQNNQAQMYGLGQIQRDQAQMYGLGQIQRDQAHLHGRGQIQRDQAQMYGYGQMQNNQAQLYGLGQLQKDQAQLYETPPQLTEQALRSQLQNQQQRRFFSMGSSFGSLFDADTMSEPKPSQNPIQKGFMADTTQLFDETASLMNDETQNDDVANKRAKILEDAINDELRDDSSNLS